MPKNDNPQSSTAAAAPPSRCDEGGDEIRAAVVPVAAGDEVRLRVVLCQSAFRVTADLDGAVIADQTNPPNDELNVLLGPLSPGIHQLHWSYLSPGPNWKTRNEVLVNGIAAFRLRKSSDGNRPFNHLGVTLLVR
jgi:hypothetical protein